MLGVPFLISYSMSNKYVFLDISTYLNSTLASALMLTTGVTENPTSNIHNRSFLAFLYGSAPVNLRESLTVSLSLSKFLLQSPLSNASFIKSSKLFDGNSPGLHCVQ